MFLQEFACILNQPIGLVESITAYSIHADGSGSGDSKS